MFVFLSSRSKLEKINLPFSLPSSTASFDFHSSKLSVEFSRLDWPLPHRSTISTFLFATKTDWTALIHRLVPIELHLASKTALDWCTRREELPTVYSSDIDLPLNALQTYGRTVSSYRYWRNTKNFLSIYVYLERYAGCCRVYPQKCPSSF